MNERSERREIEKSSPNEKFYQKLDKIKTIPISSERTAFGCWCKMMTKSREHLINLSMLYTRFDLDVILVKVMHTEHIHSSGERCDLKPDQNVCNV